MTGSRNRRGIALVWVAFIVTGLIGVIGLTCDMAYIYLVGLQLQNAADAAALAGSGQLNVGTLAQARAQAKLVAASNIAGGHAVELSLNEENLPDGHIVFGRYNLATRTFVPSLTGFNAIKVVTSRPDNAAGPLALFWGPMFGANNVRINRTAIAVNLRSSGAALICLDPDDKWALRFNGNSELDIPNGMVQVNSVHDEAIIGVGQPVIGTSDIATSSGGEDFFGSNVTFEGNLWTNAPAYPDPLEFLQTYQREYLEKNGLSSVPLRSVPLGKSVTLNPGYYPGGIKLNNGDMVLKPGAYYLGGDGLQVTGGNFSAQGVFLHVLPGPKSLVKLTGNGAINITPIGSDSGEVYSGVAIYQDAANANRAKINGTSLLNLRGTIYMPSARLEVGGTGEAYGSQIITGTAEIAGNSIVTIDYDGNFTVSGVSFLVE